MNIVFMGSAQFGIPALEKLRENGHAITGIVSTPQKESGRGLTATDSPIVQFSNKNGFGPILTPEKLKNPEFIEALRKIEADVYVVVAFRILPEEVFSLPPLGTINIHASLLPRYRGPAPIQRAIAAGEKTTGITIFRIDRGIDTGKIILQKETSVGDTETTPLVYERLARLGADCIVEALSRLRDSSAAFIEQDASVASAAPKLTKAEGNIDWSLPSRAIFNRIRAFKPFPGSYTFLEGRRVSVEWADPCESQDGSREPGIITGVDEEGFNVQCGGGSLRILEVKPEGKKNMSAKAFLTGRKLTPGARFDRQ
jgi:methionyl-tRNA formyltransferase